jgi:hypothetical protein
VGNTRLMNGSFRPSNYIDFDFTFSQFLQEFSHVISLLSGKEYSKSTHNRDIRSIGCPGG